jgi:flavin reductase (DIM6/NTAB) family NADH-FMN oxidoreductase RutF/DNA-binding MarR family transcriptional regulator
MSDQIDSKQFRNALGRFATGVTVVTACDTEDGFVGTTASSFNSVSMDPPLILWSIDKGARSLPAYENAEYFVVNILAADQVSMSNHFARQQTDKFVDIDYNLNERGVPVLPGCSAVFHCKNRFQYEGGDHIIIVGEVEEFNASERNSLLFHGGAYAVSEKHPVTAPAGTQPDPEFRSFADDYLEYLLARSFYQMHQKMASVLKLQELDDLEFRILASLSGLGDCDISTLSHYTVLSESELAQPIQRLQTRGLLDTEPSRIFLTEEGHAKLLPLLAATRSNEAEALGTFSAQEALTLKSSLRRIIDWTSAVPGGIDEQQKSLKVSTTS